MKSSHVTAVSLMNVWSHNSTDNIDDVLFLGAFRLTLALWKIMDRISCTCLSIYFLFSGSYFLIVWDYVARSTVVFFFKQQPEKYFIRYPVE